MVAIVDYGVGNLFSLQSSFAAIGAECTVTSDKKIIECASHVLLPGVGAFADARAKLKNSGLEDVLRARAAAGVPLMGVCLGMQLLFEKSYEFGTHEGLGLLKGEVVGMQGRIAEELLIPHIGYNALHKCSDHPLLKRTNEGDFVYFVHSFYAVGCEESLIATTEYGEIMTAAVGLDNVCGCQFHPEKSGNVGLEILKSFCEMGMKA